MSAVEIGIIGIVVLVIIFFIGMPVGFSMAFVGLVGFALHDNPFSRSEFDSPGFFRNLYQL